MGNAYDDGLWNKIITPKQKKLWDQLLDVWEYRELIGLFIKRDFVTYYKQTIFGPLWYLVQPILSTIMYSIIFGTVAGLGTDGIPQSLFYFSGAMMWTYFSENVKAVSNTFYANKAIFGKVFFPRLVVPISSSAGLLIKFAIQFSLFLLVYFYFIINGLRVEVSSVSLLFPWIILWICVLSCGFGMIISSITTKYRDLALILDFLISLWMYATPIVYPMSQVPDFLLTLACLNPVSVPMELFRDCFFGICSVPEWAIALSLVLTILIFMLGIVMFNRNERTFVDVI